MAALILLAAGAQAAPNTETIYLTGIPKLEKTEEFNIEHVMGYSGFLQSLAGTGTMSAKEGAPWWNDLAVGFVYTPGACTLSYGGFTSTLRYPNYQGCASRCALSSPPPPDSAAAACVARPRRSLCAGCG